ncbi:bifunctional demethylmenaquinone methyltransferase/2-methoxy-6-polyprenyl-1,4-benzoquinol methylase UbiE [Bosea sp. 685]|uniref:bifunctional demethylmenaquinone methyltransferase/2-methoxy-6-polyprenyl-1,4-benzoquinol methylase UbiE n=1 Tax=Bosea sp. 685 TaxID=3080057 RepID=UPI0028931551|nr:bifunctional demethylmenaquinone methyltransferase/2-methoxy-6-polyprenyl-1,4-benzoquinol methylase UbiE [Bosea sp. 685]WNJ90599.1 bifunctional demethylmenaquinone methyltransferase/2-methoxy-6-polyprenyl-1,4-benzoquinol methylase UbiE [Bosea sp. 685]
MTAASDTTHFGFETVPLVEKQAKVDDVFHKVASRYDLMNDLMSAGLHRLWKDALITTLKPAKDRPFHHLDVAGGTGDVAFQVLAAGGLQTDVTVLDINAEMLSVGRDRAQKRFPDDDRIRFVQGNAEALGLPDNHFDAYTIAFGIRNVPRIDKALSEAFRVLKRGGRFLCLEFSHVDVPLLDKVYEAYSFNVIPPMGRMVTGEAEPYQYLVESIRKFPKPQAFAGMIEDAGFRRAKFTPMTGGVVALHSGWKL